MAGWVNYDDVFDQLRAVGLELSGVLEVDTPRPVRVRELDGDRERRGWYWLTTKILNGEAYITGACGIYRGDDSGKVAIKLRRDGKSVPLSAEDRAAIAARQKADMARLRAMRQAQADKAASAAGNVWRRYLPEGRSDYLERKGVQAFGVRFAPGDAATLAVPMMDPAGKIHGLQIIRGKDRAKGKLEKEFWPKGLSLTGHYHLVGGLPRDVLLVTEGYATAATLHQATGLPVAVAFAANNLLPVAEVLRKAYRQARIVVCADDDYLQRCRKCRALTPVSDPICRSCGEDHWAKNPGVTAAENAAHAVAGLVCGPRFAAERPADRKGPTDFNDLAALEGEATVRTQVEATLRSAGIELQQAPRAPHNPGGAGEAGAWSRPQACSVMHIDDLVERFHPIDDGTGRFVFDTWTRKVAHRDQMVALLPAGVRADDIKRHPTWQDRGAAYIDEIGFDPSERDPGVRLNTWRGWPMDPAPGECSMLLDTIYYLCGDEPNREEVFQWLLCWMAYPLQHPGAKLSSAVVMHGPQGTGKTTVFQVLARIYGDYATVLNQRGLEDRFNSDWADSKCFILAEEVVTRQEMWHIKNELKELVTGEWIRVNPKNIAAYRQRNRVNIVYLSNENQPLPLENDDRRHLVVYNPPAQPEDYYDQLHLEIEDGGVAAFYHHLLHLDLGDWHPKKRPPMTHAKVSLMQLSAPSELRFVEDWLDGETGLPVCPCLSADLYAAYLKWCRGNGEQRPRPSNHFGIAIARLAGWEKKKARVYEDCRYTGPTRSRNVVIPPATVLAAHGTQQPEGKDTAQWLTDGVVEFSGALENGGKGWNA